MRTLLKSPLLFFFAINPALLLGCGASSSEQDTNDIAPSLEEWVADNDGELLELHLETEAVVGCPGGVVCDEEFSYRAFLVAEQGLRLRLSFDAIIANEITLDLLKEHFELATVRYEPPEIQTSKWQYQIGRDVVLRADDEVTHFTDWSEGRVQGEIQTTLTGLYGQRLDSEGANPDCFLADTALPDECTVHLDMELPLRITFDLALPLDPKDCVQSHSEGCGGSITMKPE